MYLSWAAVGRLVAIRYMGGGEGQHCHLHQAHDNT